MCSIRTAGANEINDDERSDSTRASRGRVGSIAEKVTG
jgi:hypothetical protein